MKVKIYSNEHNAWWKSNYCGYTNDESKAGVFEFEEVNKKYPYIDFDTTKEDYLVKFEGLTYEELEKENQDLKAFVDSYANARDELLIKNQKLEEAIEIIKTKEVDITCFLYSNSYAFYNFYAIENELEPLSQQEYNLLKEVLGND